MDEPFRFDPPVERRAHPRFEMLAQVRVAWEAVTYVMDVRNISVSGLFLATTDPRILSQIGVGRRVQLHLFALEELENVPVAARVARVVGPGEADVSGFGVQFVDVNPGTRERIGAMVERAAAAATPPPLPGRGSLP